MNKKRVALVTGAGRGLGADLAQRLARAGYVVAIHYRSSRAGAMKGVNLIRKCGGAADLFAADLSREAGAKKLIAAVSQKYGRLDLLINNAGVYHSKSLESLSELEWREELDSTATATFFLTRAALPFLRKAKVGRVINLGDSSCDRPTARDLAVGYHIGKTGVLILTRSFAKSEAKFGVTVNLISPGWLENSLDLPPAKSLPAGRYGTFSDIWNAVEFLIRPESSYLTGSNLVVSGGWNLR